MLTSETTRSGPYNGNDATTQFAYGFRILDKTHLNVVKTSTAGVDSTLTVDVDYTVSGVGDDVGGNVTVTVAPATGEKLTILRNVPLTQETGLENQGAYYADSVEAIDDKAMMAIQQVNEKVGRSILLPESSTLTDVTVPTPAASQLLGWSSTADGLTNYVPNTATYVVAELASVTADEATQLLNIGSTTISALQWGYLGAMSAFGGSLVDDANASAALTTLGFSAFAKTIIDDADAAAVRTTLGFTSAGLRNIASFGAGGTYTKPSWLTRALVIVTGSGGGGAGGGTQVNTGGGAGGTAIELLEAGDIGATETVTVGTGGSGGAGGGSANVGSSGNTSSFGSFCSATGGEGGSTASNTVRAGGAGSGGDLNILGGGAGAITTTGDMCSSGGASYWGGGGGGSGNSGNGANGPAYGSGGGGGSNGNAGGNGAGGFVVVYEFE